MAGPIGGFIVSALAVATLALTAPVVQAQQNALPVRHHHPAKSSVTPTPAEVASAESNTTGDIFVRKSGRNYYDGSWVPAGTTNRYFSDTKQPFYPLGPAFTAYQGGYENLPSAREPFWPGF